MKKYRITYFLGLMLAAMLAFQPINSMSNPLLQEIQDEELAEKIRIFPNPTEGRFQIQMDYEGNDRIVAKVYDITGKVVKDISDDLVKAKSSVTADIDLDSPRSGIYFLRIEMGNTMTTKKIIVR